jgi:hypothetical protein
MQGMAMCLETKHMRDATKPPYWFKHLQSAMNGKIRCQSNPAVTKGKDFTITHTGCHLNQKPCSSPRKTQPTENLIRKLSPTWKPL